MFCEGQGNIIGALKLAGILTAIPFGVFLVDLWYTNRLLREWRPGIEQAIEAKYYSFKNWRESIQNWRGVPLRDRIFYWFLVSPDYYMYSPRVTGKIFLHALYAVPFFVVWLSFNEMMRTIPEMSGMALNVMVNGVLWGICIGLYYAVERGRAPTYSYLLIFIAVIGSFLSMMPCLDSRDFIFIFAGFAAALMLTRISGNWRKVREMRRGKV